jgi:hypothetical protein
VILGLVLGVAAAMMPVVAWLVMCVALAGFGVIAVRALEEITLDEGAWSLDDMTLAYE